MSDFKNFIKSSCLVSRILFILGILLFLLDISTIFTTAIFSVESIFFDFIILIYPALMIEFSKNPIIKRSDKKLFIFLNKSKIVSRILVAIWLVFGIAGAGFKLSDIFFSLGLMAVFFLIPVIIIEIIFNPVFENTRNKIKDKISRMNKHIKDNHDRKVNRRQQKVEERNVMDSQVIDCQFHLKEIEEQNNKESVYQLVKDNSLDRELDRIKSTNKYAQLKEIEERNKESVYQLIKDKSSQQENNTIDSQMIDTNSRLREIENQNKESVNQLIKDNQSFQKTNTVNLHETNSSFKINNIKKVSLKENYLESEDILLKNLMDKIDLMNGHEFEHFCAEILRKNGYIHVSVTPGSGDQGADIIAEKGDLKYAIQCKRFQNVLNNRPVQEIGIGRVYYNCDVGVVLTNSYFNTNAKSAAKAAGILLWDRDKLIKLIKSSGVLYL